MSALGKVVRAGVGRRRVQSVVLALTTMTAVAASVMAGALVVVSQQPFDHAFAKQHGAHLTGYFDGAKASAAQVRATARASGVTASAGPYASVSATPRVTPNGAPTIPGTAPLAIAGRAAKDGPVDELTVTAGRWVSGPGQIVLDAGKWTNPDIVGARVTFPSVPGSGTLTVVGLARSVTQTADAWVAPSQIGALTAPGTTPLYEMLYRFTKAGSKAEITADRAAVTALAPAGSLTGSQSYLTTKQVVNQQTASFVPFIVAFGVLALIMSALIIGIVVSGAVSTGTRRIGILKSLGFAPAQVGRAYVGQALIPASVGAALGLLLGDLGSVPLLGKVEGAYGTPSLTVAPWLQVAVPVAVLALVVVSALTPALRAARLRTIEALAVGRTPRAGRGRFAARLTARLPMPRALSLGLAGPFARPARSLTIGTAIMFGAIGVTFAYGLGASLGDVQKGLNRDAPGQVVAQSGGPPTGGAGPAPTSGGPQEPPAQADPAAITRAIAGQSGTKAYFATGFTDVRFAGLSDSATASTYQGDSAWGAYQMVSGHWFTGPGQIVVAQRFLQATGTHVGGTIILQGDGRSTPVRIVGEALMTGNSGLRVLTDAGTLTSVGIQPRVERFYVELKSGTDRTAYIKTLNTALSPLGATAMSNTSQNSSTIVAMNAIALTLTLMLILVAGLGVLNTVVLDTRERVHSLGVLKALGMAPRQTVAMVITSVAGIGAVAGLLGVPIGIVLHHYILPVMGDAAGTRIPPVDIDVFHAAQFVPLALGGLLIAILGALLPATWVARTRTATALRTE
ncbi:FtsX-like permease family protein [Streptomyces sp. NPDC056227]|uniref:FtsX-like permease family protein n=1 Tax=Streptomyces sp. NPDC056227 TaxID=3345753 RepID=UPI0035E01BB9